MGTVIEEHRKRFLLFLCDLSTIQLPAINNDNDSTNELVDSLRLTMVLLDCTNKGPNDWFNLQLAYFGITSEVNAE